MSEWSGQLWLGPDYGLILGETGRTAPHAHYAHQFILSAESPITVSLDGHLQTAYRLFIPSRQPHAIVHAPATVLMAYVEPGAFERESLQHALETADFSHERLEQTLRQLPRRQADDERVQRALHTLDQQLSGKVSAQSLAQAAHLSLSQLERLFVSQLGVPVRRLVMWRRLRRALDLALNGHTLTQAAHGAGFADSAHFSRTMKQLFGVTAGASLRHLQVHLLQ
ncbi:AraC family transcriptional regulator [Pseudomonas fluorescens]|uniref:helix-turn-helix domain-containing protein n=1 Tax=Pseudomonas TaxID=286 RepID=UPI0007CF135D|nr:MULTISPECIES: AraC family transcriptional regulator [Pseudomonas]AYG09336.1 AraC family transcriptional regulator [Pseudomonas fluorescens]OAE14675.1 AraC family transcriptional regulator [Pseudomonas brenneri]MBK3453998.1 helix-turn-helix transcriptional regulator [Pseudomonas sp. MF6754]MBU4625872.1 helix-turn-helix transcriptional regulator [Pseudomonas sp. BF61]QXH88113.1 AraC family transcriptional regulator [Pseudomonas shahriarae]